MWRKIKVERERKNIWRQKIFFLRRRRKIKKIFGEENIFSEGEEKQMREK